MTSNMSWNDAHFEIEQKKLDRSVFLESSQPLLNQSKSHARLDKSPQLAKSRNDERI
jgi:hypothetical protein